MAARSVGERGNQYVRFQRDQTCRVVAFDYANPVLRHVTFTRLNEGATAR